MQYENFPVSYQHRRKDPAVAFFKIIKDSLRKHFNQTKSPQQSFLALPYISFLKMSVPIKVLIKAFHNIAVSQAIKNDAHFPR